jgi:hypothetical protein
MELTLYIKSRGKCKDGKTRGFAIFRLNGVDILKQKLPYIENADWGFQHQTSFKNIYLLGGRLYQTRVKEGKRREVSFPVSKSKLQAIDGYSDNVKITLLNYR